MARYRVHLETGAACTVEVEAEDVDEAMDKALDHAPRSLCAHCSRVDIGEWDVSMGLADKGEFAVELVED